MKIARVLFFIAFICAGLSAQAKYGMLPTVYQSVLQLKDAPVPASTKLLYYGGPVISNPKVWMIEWSGINIEVHNYGPGFYSAVTNSTMMDWLNQYATNITAVGGKPGTNQSIGRGQYMGLIKIKPFFHGGAIDDKEIQVEILKQIAAGNLPRPDDNTLFMIYFPRNMMISAFGSTSCVNFCAYHSSHGAPTDTDRFFYGVMPDITNSGCDMGCAYGMDHLSSMTAISSHEYTEATTDPYPTPGSNPSFPQAWNTFDGSEIGDLCAGTNNELSTPRGSYLVQSEFDNSTHSCTNKKWTSP